MQVSFCGINPFDTFFFESHIKAKSKTSTFFHLGSVSRNTCFLFFTDLEKLIHVFVSPRIAPRNVWLSSVLCQKCQTQSRFSSIVRLLSSAGNMNAFPSCLSLKNYFISGLQQTSSLSSTSAASRIPVSSSPVSSLFFCLLLGFVVLNGGFIAPQTWAVYKTQTYTANRLFVDKVTSKIEHEKR